MMSNQSITTLLWSYATAGVQPLLLLHPALTTLLNRPIHALKPNQVANLVWALAKLRTHLRFRSETQQLLLLVAVDVNRRIGEFQPGDVRGILWGLATCRVYCAPLLQAAASVLQQLLKQEQQQRGQQQQQQWGWQGQQEGQWGKQQQQEQQQRQGQGQQEAQSGEQEQQWRWQGQQTGQLGKLEQRQQEGRQQQQGQSGKQERQGQPLRTHLPGFWALAKGGFYEEALAEDLCRAAKAEVAAIAVNGHDCSMLLVILRLWRYRDDELLNMLADEVIPRCCYVSAPAAAAAVPPQHGNGSSSTKSNRSSSMSSSSSSNSSSRGFEWSSEQISECCTCIATIGYSQPKQQKLLQVLTQQYIEVTASETHKGASTLYPGRRPGDRAVAVYKQSLRRFVQSVRVLWSCAVLGFTGARELMSLVRLVRDSYSLIVNSTGTALSGGSSSSSSGGYGTERVNGRRGMGSSNSDGSGSRSKGMGSKQLTVEDIADSIQPVILCQLHQVVMFLEVRG